MAFADFWASDQLGPCNGWVDRAPSGGGRLSRGRWVTWNMGRVYLGTYGHAESYAAYVRTVGNICFDRIFSYSRRADMGIPHIFCLYTL